MLRFDVGQPIAESPINAMRNDIREYIRANPENLSLYCDGNCFAHHDGIVLWCHDQFITQAKPATREEG